MQDCAVTHRLPATATAPTSEQATGMRHTVAPNTEHIEKHQSFANALKTITQPPCDKNDEWILVQKKKRVHGNKGY